MVNQKVNEIIENINKPLSNFPGLITPVFKIDDNNEPYHAGTAFGVEINGNKFILTAAHVLAKNEMMKNDEDDQFFLFCRDQLVQIEKFEKRYIAAIGNEEIDCVVIRLIENDFGDVFKSYIQQSDVIDCDRLTNKSYLAACGFPETKNKKKWHTNELTQNPYGYFGNIVSNKELHEFGYSSQYCLGLHIDLKRVYRDAGKKMKAPKPEGISGGPIFVVHDFSNASKIIKPKLCGLVFEKTNNSKAIIGVDIRVIIKALTN